MSIKVCHAMHVILKVRRIKTNNKMTISIHRIYIFILASIVVLVTFWLGIKGWSYYSTSLEERFYHPSHESLKPSGSFGHGIGILGTFLVLFGVFSYIARKRYRFLHKFGRLKHWLEFHIFLCTLGPIMILFHTAFKFGGIVSISFWSMVAVVASGVLGRFIYIQIPRTIEGRELSLNELTNQKEDLELVFKERYGINDELYGKLLQELRRPQYQQTGNILKSILKKHREDSRVIKRVRQILNESQIKSKDINQILLILKSEITLDNKISRLQQMQQLFRYWHVAHLPFAIIMLVIMVIHVIITLAFGYRWIF